MLSSGSRYSSAGSVAVSTSRHRPFTRRSCSGVCTGEVSSAGLPAKRLSEAKTTKLLVQAGQAGDELTYSATQFVSLSRDDAARRPGALRASWRRVRRSPVLQRQVWRQLCDYDRPDFHPDDVDTRELVERWRAELFGAEGTLNDKLATSAA